MALTLPHVNISLHDITHDGMEIIGHQMKIFSALLTICAWNSPATDEFPVQRSVTRSYDVFFHLRID